MRLYDAKQVPKFNDALTISDVIPGLTIYDDVKRR